MVHGLGLESAVSCHPEHRHAASRRLPKERQRHRRISRWCVDRSDLLRDDDGWKDLQTLWRFFDSLRSLRMTSKFVFGSERVPPSESKDLYRVGGACPVLLRPGAPAFWPAFGGPASHQMPARYGERHARVRSGARGSGAWLQLCLPRTKLCAWLRSHRVPGASERVITYRRCRAPAV